MDGILFRILYKIRFSTFFRCGHYDSAIDYAGEFKLPVSALATDDSFVPLLSGMFIKNVVSVNLKINGDFTSPFSLALSPSDANRGSRYQISFGDSFGTTTKERFHVFQNWFSQSSMDLPRIRTRARTSDMATQLWIRII